MHARLRSLAFLAGVLAVATAQRRFFDLGSLVPSGVFWTLAATGGALIGWGARDRGVGCFTGATRVHVCCASLVATVWLLLDASPRTAPLIIMATLLAGAGWARRPRIGARIAMVACVYVLGLGVVWAVEWATLLRPSLAAVPRVFAALFAALGAECSAAGDSLVVETMRAHRPFLIGPVVLGLSVHSTVAGAWLTARLFCGSKGVVPVFRSVGYVVTAAALRVAALVALSSALEGATDWDDPDFPSAPFLGWGASATLDLIAFVGAAPIWLRGASPDATTGPRDLRLTLVGAALLTGVMMSSDRVLDCLGSAKAGRIAIDEGHSFWEATDVRLGRETYGSESGYNFRALVDWLQQSYGPVRRLYDPLGPGNLQDVSVLIVKTPTRHFTSEELVNVRSFVERGGGLILIGDHTNVFGTGSVLNEIARPFGFHYDFDCLFDERATFEQLYRVEPKVREHPVLRDVDQVLFEVGCSIEIDKTSVRPLVVGRGLKSKKADYSVGNFYPQPSNESDMLYGQFAQLVVTTHGRGRVVAIADSTLFSTFSVCMPGRRELVEGAVAWTNRIDVGAGVRRASTTVCSIAVVVLIMTLLGRGAVVSASVLLLVVAGSVVSRAAAERFLYPGNPRTARGAETHEVHFLADSAVAEWPVDGFVDSPERDYGLFFQYVTRTGQFPRLVTRLEDAINSDAPLVIIDPLLGAAQMDSLEQFVRDGGTLVVAESRANEVVDRFAGLTGQHIRPASPVREFRSRFGRIDPPFGHTACRGLKGSRELLIAERMDGSLEAVGTVGSLGAGSVVLLTCGRTFANISFGYSYWVIPDESTRRLYEFTYSLFSAVGDTAEEPRIR